LRVIWCALAKDLPSFPHPPKSSNSGSLGPLLFLKIIYTLTSHKASHFKLFDLLFFFTQMNLKHELQSIISGIGDHSAEDIINAEAYYIRKSQKTSGNSEKFEFTKKQEAKKLD